MEDMDGRGQTACRLRMTPYTRGRARAAAIETAKSSPFDPRWLRRLRSTGAAEQPDPARASERMQTQGDESQRDEPQQPAAVGLGQKEQECPAEAVDLARSVMDSCLDEKPADHKKGDAPRSQPETAKPDRELPFVQGHLGGLQVLREDRPVRLDELPDADPDGDDAEQFSDEAAAGVRQQGADRLLGAVV